MKNKTINTSISLMLLMLIFAVPGHAALPFLQGITNGEVSHIKFAEDESLFVAIKNNSNTILYDQESYPVTSGSLSLMKISPNGNLEWIKDLYTDLQNNLDYDVNVLNGRRAYVQFRGNEFHTRNARSRQLQEQRRAKAQR